MSFFEDETVHFTINEKNPLSPRYEVQDVIIGNPDPAS